VSANVQELNGLSNASPHWPQLLVRNAIAAFAEQHLSGYEALTARLYSPRLSESLGLGDLTWAETLDWIEQQPVPLGTPLQNLFDDLDLSLADLFLLALCGEVEQSHDLNMLLAAMQAPDEGSRPTLHLVSAILEQQFGLSLPPGRLHQHLLVRMGLLKCEGTQPMPLRTLSTDPDLWSLLNGSAVHWPGLRKISLADPPDNNELLTEVVESVAQEFNTGRTRGILIRGDRSTGRQCMAMLAERLRCSAVTIDLDTWQGSPLAAAACRYAGWLPVIEHSLSPGERLVLKQHEQLAVPLAVLTGNDGAVDNHDFLQLQLPSPHSAKRLELWQHLLGKDPSLDILASSALIDQQRIREIARQVTENLWPDSCPLGYRVAQVRSQLGTQQLRTLCHPVERHVDDDALVLSPTQQARFDALVRRCVQRESLWEHLGPTLSNTRNSGVRALFSGESGTGKTLAASRLATCLNAPLFRLDMASVMNKYIGETEKNLSAMLDEAATTDVILLLDEADALFGKRSDGDSGGERFANMLTNFLLTRIENHPGIVILTSNSQLRIDEAFTRRFDVVIEFTLPGYEERLRLWKNHLGDRSPGDDEVALLASFCDLPGGYIRNTVLNAAAMQPSAERLRLDIRILVGALHEEYRKLGRGLPPALTQIREATIHD